MSSQVWSQRGQNRLLRWIRVATGTRDFAYAEASISCRCPPVGNLNLFAARPD
jgi:hypothetical protein